MPPSGSVFSATLQTITSTKLEELAKQRIAYEEQYAVLLAAAAAEKDPIQRLFLLVNGAKACLGVKTVVRKNKDHKRLGPVVTGGTSNPHLETDLKNLDRFLEQARYDPSVSPKVLQNWEDSLLTYLSVQSSKYTYADLYGKLVTEWLSSEKAAANDGDVEMAESFEEIPGAKKLEARTEWEKVVFDPAVVNTQDLKQYLHQLFMVTEKSVSKAVEKLREKVEKFENELAGSAQFNSVTLRRAIGGLQSSDLLDNEKREVLKDFLGNDIILAEIADVLNMRMTGLHRWTWGDHVPIEQRRKLNGSFSIQMHEDLLQAIFLHWIGTKWSVFFKQSFVSFRADAWKSNHSDVPKRDRKRREYYLGQKGVWTTPNIQEQRAQVHQQEYFAHQLLDHDQQRIVAQEGEEEADFKNSARERDLIDYSDEDVNLDVEEDDEEDEDMGFGLFSDGGKNNDDEYNPTRQTKSPIQAKQRLLHLLSTEIVINTQLHGQLACFRSVFKSWNPLLPHSAVLEVLEFFGVSEKWRKFFETFLQAPLKFIGDGNVGPRLRRRGIPESHALSDVFGEVVLSCLDFAVNQATDGEVLHRIYDDFWFWSHDYDKCVQAWDSVTVFAKVMGVQLADSKTGSVHIAQDKRNVAIDDRLPRGEIRWGFLYLDPSSGRFEIDQKMVDAHVDELKTQLKSKSKSVIDWISAWNSYAATFFASNFGKAANCFGREHVDEMLATHRRIQESIFDGGNVVHFLKHTIKQRFGVDHVPDGFLFFPVELGGLDLKSPFVNLLQIREGVRESPYELMKEFFEAEQDAYSDLKRTFDKADTGFIAKGEVVWNQRADPNTFFSFEEYTRYREVTRGHGVLDLVKVYNELLKKPNEESIDISIQVRNALDQLRGHSNLKGITADWNSMDAYWKWVAQMYGPEMIEKFGGLSVVDYGLLPIGMVSMFRQKRIKWQG